MTCNFQMDYHPRTGYYSDSLTWQRSRNSPWGCTVKQV